MPLQRIALDQITDLVISITGTDATGARTNVLLSQQATPPPMRVGLSATPAEYDTWYPKFPDPAYARIFSPPGSGMPDLTGRASTGLPATAVRAYSYKDRQSAADLKRFFDAKPRGLPIEITFHHEHEDDWAHNPVPFRSQWQLLRKVADDHPERQHITLTNIHNLYAARWRRGVDWRAFMLPGVADVEAWDVYAPGALDGYEPPESLLGLPLAAVTEFGISRWKLAEVGAARKSWDTTGAGRAAWLLATADYAAGQGCETFGLWCSRDSKGDFRPTDPATHDAFTALLARNHA